MGDRENTRRVLLDAARDAVLRFGYKKTTVDDIASMAGLSRATFYNYFPGKEAVIMELLNEEIAALRSAIWEDTAMRAGPRERLLSFVEARYRNLKRTRELYAVVMGAGRELLTLAPRSIDEFEKEQQSYLAGLLREGMEMGIFKPVDSDLLSAALISALRGLDEAYMFESRDMLSKGARVLVETLLRGLRP